MTSVLQRRRYAAVLLYTGVIWLSYTLAYLIRFEFRIPVDQQEMLVLTLLPVVAVRLAAFRLFRITRERWRFVGARNIVQLGGAVAVGSVLLYALNILATPFGITVPRSVLLAEAIFTACFTAAAWLSYRMAMEAMREDRSNGAPRRVIVIGAGEAGTLLVREMLRGRTGYIPLGFVDDDPHLERAGVLGIPVLGRTEDLPRIAHHTRADELIIAVPSATPEALRNIVARCEATGLRFRVLPGIHEVLHGEVQLNQVREVQIEDLLGRAPIRLELPELEQDLHGRTILITGAAGSIGSELSRQVALHNPGRLVVLDQSETGMFFLDSELRGAFPGVPIVPIITDIVNEAAMRDVFEQYSPSHVFHAAAYKHVPLMQLHPREAVRNNVLGTFCVARLAGEYGAQKFVLVSTDKAVRPSNVMGATKRLAELLVLELQWRHRGTSYRAVRFGNVLGSAGSVIPIFRRQLDAGLPLTVTDPETTRFFMTIPEAVQLILQASLLEELRGRIAMLEMGEPVRILDLAYNLLRLGGHPVNSEAIAFTGLRPGEKLHEELVAPDEEASDTEVPRVRMLTARDATPPTYVDLIQRTTSLTEAECAVLSVVDEMLREHGGDPLDTRHLRAAVTAERA